MRASLEEPWNVFAALTARFYATAPGAGVHRGDGWFASLSYAPSGELNVCGLMPGASEASAEALSDVIGEALPAIVFTSGSVGHDVREVMRRHGFEIASVPEPLMRCDRTPEPTPGAFRIARAEDDAEIDVAIGLTAEAHRVERELLGETIGEAARRNESDVWLAWEESEPVSALWLVRAGENIGVMEMMTPERHQRRGAGRCLITGALHATWSSAEDALLLSTPAGRRLYESIGFTAVDESLTCHRGSRQDVFNAIGQAP